MLDAIIGYYRALMLHVPFEQSLSEEPVWNTVFDVETWRDDDFSKPLSAYRYEEERQIQTRVDARRKEVLLERINTFGEHPNGLGRFTRTMFATDFRRYIDDGEQEVAAE